MVMLALVVIAATFLLAQRQRVRANPLAWDLELVLVRLRIDANARMEDQGLIVHY
jgi:hypothetical protein